MLMILRLLNKLSVSWYPKRATFRCYHDFHKRFEVSRIQEMRSIKVKKIEKKKRFVPGVKVLDTHETPTCGARDPSRSRQWRRK